jgi:hypothetical protein
MMGKRPLRARISAPQRAHDAPDILPHRALALMRAGGRCIGALTTTERDLTAGEACVGSAVGACGRAQK